MSAYHQMGHNSRNLLLEKHLSTYSGAILSPVNDPEQRMAEIIQEMSHCGIEFILDPQLYYPGARRGHLVQWAYFPSDVDTADQADSAWWEQLSRSLAQSARRIGATAVCSPAIVPRVHSLEYYQLNCQVAMGLKDILAPARIDVLLTLLVRSDSLAAPGIPEEIASIVTSYEVDRVYLVLVTDVRPRLELRDADILQGAVQLIRYLESSGIRCATGKYFNLRRFTPSRWKEPSEGGGQLPYWFEESLMAFLREGDLIRVRNAGMLSQSSSANPYGQKILDNLDNPQPQAWLGLSWRHYMYWFAQFEARVSAHQVDPEAILANAERAWAQLDSSSVLMEERHNNGQWLRPWRLALQTLGQ